MNQFPPEFIAWKNEHHPSIGGVTEAKMDKLYRLWQNSTNSTNSQNSQTGGNTKPQSFSVKQCPVGKKWCFTYNNYPENWIEVMKLENSQKSTIFQFNYVIGQEVGNSGTPHLQGYLEFDKERRPSALDWPKVIHFEKAKGSRAQNIAYCTKDGKFIHSDGFKIPKPLKLITPDRPYQVELLEILSKEPDDRKVMWIWEPAGKVGKTQFAKYICAKHGGVITAGRNSDMKNAIVNYHEKAGNYPEIVILNVPREILQYVSYTGIEEVKDGCFASTKFECGMVLMNSPHLLIFANEPPRMSALSEDRWWIRRIDENMCLVE
nr:MAG: replication associated protein [Cressdnaviricota sp.]